MPWPTPAPGDIANRAAATYEAIPALAGIDARSENSLAAANCKLLEGGMLDLYFEQGNIAQEMMVDTAQANLARFGNIWGVPQLQPTPSSGTVTFTGSPTTVIPSAFELTAPSGVIISTTASATIGSGGSVSVAVSGQASDGSASNQASGTVLKVTTPLPGLAPQQATVCAASDGSGLSGGTDIQDIEAWRARILARIRLPSMGGSKSDYVTWAKQALDTVAQVNPITAAGSVAVVISMVGPCAPTTAEIAIVQAYLTSDAVGPVTADITVAAATLAPVNFTIHLNPDTPAIRAAVINALTLEFLLNSIIGSTGYFSRYQAAISSANGEWSNELSAPTVDVACGPAQLLTLGVITWV